jgi:hypothetical protein
VLPEQRCVSDDGELRRTPHARRAQLAYALTTNEDCRGREAADFYRELFPDVDVSRITCAPSRRQYRWRTRWSSLWQRLWRTEDEAEAAYQAEQGCSCTSFGDDETPALEAMGEQLALGPGQTQESLAELVRRAQRGERVRRIDDHDR